MDTKKPYLSKTLWLNLIIAISAFFPVVQHFITTHSEQVMIGFSLLNMGLRTVTKDKLSLGD